MYVCMSNVQNAQSFHCIDRVLGIDVADCDGLLPQRGMHIDLQELHNLKEAT